MLQQGGLLFRIKNLAKLAIFTILSIGFGGCILLLPMLWPVKQKNVIGTYQSVLENGTPELPDGGSEILELRADGTCKQNIILKDGRNFSTQGTWEWRPHGSYFSTVIVMGLYWVIRDGGINPRINPDLEADLGNVVQSLPVGRTLTGRVMLGSDEGPHYEKK